MTGTLGGVLITQRNVVRVAEKQLLEQRQTQLRSTITSLSHLGERWAGGAMGMLSQVENSSPEHLEAFLQSPTWREHAEITAALNEAFVDADLRVSDRPLVGTLSLSRLLFRGSNQMVGIPAMIQAVRGEPDERRMFVTEGRDHLVAFNESLYALSNEAADLLRVQHASVRTSMRLSSRRGRRADFQV